MTTLAVPRTMGAAPSAPDHSDYLARFLHRTHRMLNARAVQRLRSARVVIAGCGGVGAAVALTMARLGVGRFVLADPGLFDEPDVNRQWGADRATLGQNKAMVYADWLARINPTIEADVHTEGVTCENVDHLVNGADLVVDCLDISVDLALRARLFRRAAECGAYSATAPVIGFGSFIAIAAPDGMSMEPVIGMLRQVVQSARLPAFARDFYSPLCVEALERDMPTGKLPSLAIGPTVAGALVCTELLLILLRGHLTPWREPICLPRVLLTDTLSAGYRIASLPDLLGMDSTAATAVRDDCTVATRSEWLRAAHYNTHCLPAERVAVDLLTDSWAELPDSARPAELDATEAVEERFGALYGYPHVLAVNRGRSAEALLAAAFIQSGMVVAGNALFPTTRFHIESRGATLLDLTGAGPTADLDLDRLSSLIAGHTEPRLACVWVEACCNALGGAPLTLANLRAIHEQCRLAGIPVLLDATRLLDNVLLCQQHAGIESSLAPLKLLHAFAQHTDGCALGAAKDFPLRHGGFIAVHSAKIGARLSDLLLAFGSSLAAEHRRSLAAALHGDPFAAPGERLRRVQRLHQDLRVEGIPLLEPCGGHALVIDAGRLLPHLGAEDQPAQALANFLYLRAGIRCGRHFAAARQAGRALLRLAVPVARYTGAELELVVQTLAAVARHPDQVRGLRCRFRPAGALADFHAHFELIDAE